MLIPPGNAPIGPCPQISCQGQAQQMVSETHLLVVTVDNKLTWSSHTNKVNSKVSRKIGALRRSNDQLTPASRRLFFLTVIQPDFEYAASAIVTSMPFSQKKATFTLEKSCKMRCRNWLARRRHICPKSSSSHAINKSVGPKNCNRCQKMLL